MMKISLVLLAAMMIIAAGQKSKPADQPVAGRQDKVLCQLEKRQYDENIYDEEVMKRVLSKIKNDSGDSAVEISVEDELFREWLKQSAIFRIQTEILDDHDIAVILDAYLKRQGIHKTIPDRVTYYNGYPFIKYYKDDESGKVAFAANIYRDSSLESIYCGVAYAEDFKKEGDFIYDFDQNGRLLSEKFYDNQGGQVSSVSYTYNINVPFPIITEYYNREGEEGGFYSNVYLNTGQRFWIYDHFLEFDENGRWIKYNGDIYSVSYSGSGIESYNVPIYGEEGRLERIVETLRGSRYQDNPEEWMEDGEIEFEYRDNGRLAEVDYGGFSGNHGSSGNSGSIFYDENGRIVHIESFHSSGDYHYFYLYQDNESYPFAVFTIGGMPYSSEDYDGYYMIFGMDFDAWLFLDEPHE